MAQGAPKYNEPTWNGTSIGRCDQAAGQRVYGLRNSAGAYADCFKNVAGAGTVGLKSSATASPTQYYACLGGAATAGGRLAIQNTTLYPPTLRDMELTNRTIWFDRKPSTSSTWTNYIASTTASGGDGNNWSQAFSTGSGTAITYDFRAHYDGETGVDPSTTIGYAYFSITWDPAYCQGDLRVTTNPALPSQISLNSVIADSWALNWVKLPPSSYIVRFTHVEGYTKPADQVVTVVDGATTTVTGTFVQRGSLRVITSPSVPGTIKVDGIPRNDSGMWTDIPTGTHQVCFGAVAGYNPPACQTVTVNAGALTTVTGSYTVNSAAPGASGVGYLRVTTNPALPTQILLDGVIADSWGLDWLKLTPGSYTVRFSHIEGYTEPADQVVSVVNGATTTVTGTFTQRGSLRVITSPAVAGTIKVYGTPRNDWGMWTDMPTGSYQVCFGAVDGYAIPACQTVTVNAGALTTVTGVYQ